MASSARARRVEALFVAVVLGLFVFTCLSNEVQLLRGHLMDDAYISLRYAQNLAAGNGLVYNAGDRVEGYTNFALTVLLSVPYACGFDPIVFVKAIGWISGASLVVTTGMVTRRVAGAGAAAGVMIVMALDDRIGWFSGAGLETLMVGALYMPALLLLDRKRVIGSALLFAAAALTRMETVFLAALASLFLLHRSGLALPRLRDLVGLRWTTYWAARPVRFCLTFLAVFGPYYGWRFAYYGWAFPNTYYAKVGSFACSWRRGAAYLDDSFRTMGLRPALLATGAALAVVVVSLLWRRRRAKARALGMLVLAMLIVYTGYVVAVGGDHFNARFVCHFYPLLLVAIAWTWRAFADLLGVWLSRVRARAVAAVIMAAMLAPLTMSKSMFPSSAGITAWQATGAYIRDHSDPRAVVATCAAGILPLESDRRTIDMLGLADSHIAHLDGAIGSGIAGHEKTDPAYVLDQRPDFITTWIEGDGQVGWGLRRFYRFWRDYELHALVRMDTLFDPTPDRLLRIEDERDLAALALLRQGKGDVAGDFAWGLWRRRKQPAPPRPLGRFDVASPVPGALDRPGALLAVDRGHTPGYLLYGPGMIFPVGAYRVSFDLELSRGDGDGDGIGLDETLCTFDAWNGVAVVVARVLRAREWLDRPATLSFALPITSENASRPIDLRLHCAGLVNVRITRGDVRTCGEEDCELPPSLTR